ncbi:lateral signaling target protein 2 homolog isoform X2 [Ambystoma mexicanum]
MQTDPQHYLSLLNQLHMTQERMLSLIAQISEQCIPHQLHRREYQVKFPDELLNDNISTHMLFAAELLVSGTYIEVDESDGMMLSPLAREVLYSLEELRTVLREQSLTDPGAYTEPIHKALIQFDTLSAEFELRYVSLVVSVKTPEEIFKQQEIVVLFCETVERALKLGYLTQDMIDVCEPQLMFTIPRLSIISGLLIYPDGPLSLQRRREDMSKLFSPFYGLLKKIRDLLYVLSEEEIAALEKSLCSADSDDTKPLIPDLNDTQSDFIGSHSKPDMTCLGHQSDLIDFNNPQLDQTVLPVSSDHRKSSVTCLSPVSSNGFHDLVQVVEPIPPVDIVTPQHKLNTWSRELAATSRWGVCMHRKMLTPKNVVGAVNQGEVQETALDIGEFESLTSEDILQCVFYVQNHGEQMTSCSTPCFPGQCYSEGPLQTAASKCHISPQDLVCTVHHHAPQQAVSVIHNRVPQRVIYPMPCSATLPNAQTNHDTITASTPSPMHHKNHLLQTPSKETLSLHQNPSYSKSLTAHHSNAHDAHSPGTAQAFPTFQHHNPTWEKEPSVCSAVPQDSEFLLYHGFPQYPTSPMHHRVLQVPDLARHHEVPLVSAYRMHHWVPQASAPSVYKERLQDSATTLHHMLPQDPDSPMPPSVPGDSVFTMLHGISEDPTSKMHHREHNDSASPLHTRMLWDSASPLHHGQPRDVASPLHHGQPRDVASPLHHGQPRDVVSPLHHGQTRDVVSPLHHGQTRDVTSPMHHGEPCDVASPMHHGAPLDSASPVHQREPLDSASPVHQREPLDSASPVHQREPLDSASAVHHGVPPDSAHAMHHGISEETASIMHPKMCRDTASPMDCGLPQISASPIHHGAPKGLAPLVDHGVPEGSASLLYHGVPQDFRDTMHYGALQISAPAVHTVDPQETVFLVQRWIPRDSSPTVPNERPQDSSQRIPTVLASPMNHAVPQMSAFPVHRAVRSFFSSPMYHGFSQDFATPLHLDIGEYPLSLHQSSPNCDVPECSCRGPSQNAAFTHSVAPSLEASLPMHHRTSLSIQDSCVIDNVANLERSVLGLNTVLPGSNTADLGNSGLFRQTVLQARDAMRNRVHSDTAPEHCRRMGPQPPITSRPSRRLEQNLRNINMQRQKGLRDARESKRMEIRSRYRSTSDMLHRLFVCIAGVADQLQTNFASDLRPILKTVFEIAASKPETFEIPDTARDEESSAPTLAELISGRPLEDCVLCTEINVQASEEGERKPNTNGPPEWVPDSASSSCMDCQAPFTLVRRRHHCRSCGKIFCSKCSTHMVPLPHFGHMKAVRVCNHCFATHRSTRHGELL